MDQQNMEDGKETTEQSCPQDIYTVLSEMATSLGQLKMDVALLQRENEEQAAKLKELEGQKTEIDKLKQQLQVRQVAFSASLSAGDEETIGPISSHTNLVFKHVLTNVGNAYNPNTGVFTAPLRGLYHFEWFIGAHGHVTGAALLKNAEFTFTAFERQSEGYGTSSQGASLLLEVGDVVFLRLWQNTQIFDNRNHHTTFSGHLLFTT